MLQRQAPRDIIASPLPIHLGAFLKMLRDRRAISQAQVIAHLPGWKQSSYSKVEKDTRCPTFDQLVPIYNALAQAGVQLTLQDRRQFVLLAKKKIEAMKTRHERKSEADWEELRFNLAAIDRLPLEMQRQGDVLVARGAKPRFAETRHLVGREEWLALMISRLQGLLPKKLLILQGPVGIGKTSELHRLARQFLHPPSHSTVVLCELPPVERSIGPESALDMLFGEILGEVGQSDATLLQVALETRIAFVLGSLERASKPVLLFLDNAENLLEEQGGLAWCWERFLKKFLQWQHQATLVLATKEWGGWFEDDKTFVEAVTIPSLDAVAGITLLQQSGLQDVSPDLLTPLHEAIGGVPQGLKWAASLIKNPMAFDSWEVFDPDDEETDIAGEPSQSTLVQRIQRLLNDPTILGGPVATRLKPLLDRVLEKRLSLEARQVLYQLAVANIALGTYALRTLCPRPSLLQEVKSASLLIAYENRVQILPLVAAALRTRLSTQQKRELEEHLAVVLFDWLATSKTLSDREMGMICTELAEIYLRHHRLLDAAQFLIRYGWMSFKLGHTRRLAECANEVLKQDWSKTEENGCGALLLHYFLSPYLGKQVDDLQRTHEYRSVLAQVAAGTVKLQAHVDAYLVRMVLACQTISELDFDGAHVLLDDCSARLSSVQATEVDLQAILVDMYAFLFAQWSEYTAEQKDVQMALDYQERCLVLYQQAADLLSGETKHLSSLQNLVMKKRLARVLTNLAYQLNRAKQYEKALDILGQSIDLKEAGYVEGGSLAPAYGEKSQILRTLERFDEALVFDQKAVEEIERVAQAGDTRSQEELWIYRVNRALLYIDLGRLEEAEHLLLEAKSKIHPRRKRYRMVAERALESINQKQEEALSANPQSQKQLDWRWVDQLRQLSAYNAFWWLTQSGPFSEEEQRTWDELVRKPSDEVAQKQMEMLLKQSRTRELIAALAEQRQPSLWYPAIPVDEVRARIAAFLQLEATLESEEPHPIIRHLYQDAIAERVWFLRLIEAAHERESDRFLECNRQLYPQPTQEGMNYIFSRIRRILVQGSMHETTQEAARQVVQLLSEQMHVSLDLTYSEAESRELQDDGPFVPSPQSQQGVSFATAKRFYEAVFLEQGYHGWRVIADPNAQGPRVEAGLRQFFLPERPLTLGQVKAYLEHEFDHIEAILAGEQSPLGLLAIGCRGYMPINEGLALYREAESAKRLGKSFDESRIWLNSLAVGLACGVSTPPQSFHSLYAFLKAFMLLYRLLKRPDEDEHTAQQKAHEFALTLCLRAFRGVTNLNRIGLCYMKDWVYVDGWLKVTQSVAQDQTLLDRLSVGRVALEDLGKIEQLGIHPPAHSLRQIIQDPNLDAYILSFQQPEG